MFIKKIDPSNLKKTCVFGAFVFVLFFVIQSCRKMDTIKQVEIDVAEQFFRTTPNTNPIVLRVVNNLKIQNNKTNFVPNLVTKDGFPLWNKSVIKLKPNTSYASRSATDNDNSDTVVLIPIVQPNTTKVNAYIEAHVTDTVIALLQEKDNYTNYSYGVLNASVNDAEKFAYEFMLLECKVFGHTKFKVLDRELFKTAYQASSNNTMPQFRFIKIKTVTDGNNNKMVLDIEPCVEIWWNPDGDDCNCNGDEYFDHYEGDCGSGGGSNGFGFGFGFGGTGTGLSGGVSNPPYTGSGGGSSGGSGGSNPPGSGWVGVTDDDPPITTEEYLKNVINSVSGQSDSIYNLSLGYNPTIEYGFLICQRPTGTPYARNIKTDNDEFSVTYNQNVQPDERIIGLLHTHADPDTTLLQAPSDDDLSSLRKFENKKNFVKFVECGNKRYALIITDPIKAKTFFSGHPKEDIRKSNELYIENNLGNSTVSIVTEQWLIQYLGTASSCGIGFYVAQNLPRKNIFKKLN